MTKRKTTTRHAKPTSVGALLKELRTAGGITQEAVAKAAGVSGAYIAKVEAGKRGISLNRIPAVAELLGIDPTRLMTPQQLAQMASMVSMSKPQPKKSAKAK